MRGAACGPPGTRFARARDAFAARCGRHAGWHRDCDEDWASPDPRFPRGHRPQPRADDAGELSQDVLPVLLVLGGLWADPPIASEGVLRTCTRLVWGALCRALE